MKNFKGKYPSPVVSIVIANWNGRKWLEKCLPTLEAQTYRDFEIIIVDNGSTDGSARWLGQTWPEIRVLEHEQNLGFARANNIAIQAAKGKHIVTLNNDTLADPAWLENLVSAAVEPDVGMVASKIVLWENPGILDSAGIEVDRVGIAWNRGWGRPSHIASTARSVFGPSAAAALYSREMLDQVGLFDEDFYAYYEDVDLAWRAQRGGWRCRYAPGARIMHWHSATGERTPDLKAYLLGRNKVWTILKNYDWPAFLWALPLIILFDIMAVGYQVLGQRNLAGLRGRLKAIRHARRALAKREPGGPVSLSPMTPPWRFLAGIGSGKGALRS